MNNFYCNKVAIVGLGLIGGSIALDLKAGRRTGEVVGVDENEAHREVAVSSGLASRFVSLEEACAAADLVILATPVHSIPALLVRVLDRLQEGASVTDMGSTKETICRAVAQHPRRQNYVAAHPIAGTENSGPSAALLGLFTGRTAVVCDAEKSGARDLSRVEGLFDALGMRRVRMSSTDHDLHAAYVSHLSHISSFVLANTVLAKEKDVTTIFDLAGGGFESTVRLAKSSPEMWTPIFEQNLEYVSQALGAYISQLQNFRDDLEACRFDQVRSSLQEANRIRKILARFSVSRSPSEGSNET